MKRESSRDHRSAIESIFAPKSVALIGATDTPGSVGRALTENLRGFKGRVHFINPKKPRVLGAATCATIGDVSEPVDLAVIATKAATVSQVVRDCEAAGVKGGGHHFRRL